MSNLLKHQVALLGNSDRLRQSTIPWCPPIPYFGDINTATVATLGINPSDREVQDENGNEISGDKRRFPTLSYLGISSWNEVRDSDLELIRISCINYFMTNPYDSWFRKLDSLIAPTNTSLYSSLWRACHVDIVPYATVKKWSQLQQRERDFILDLSSDFFVKAIVESNIRLLILNGRTVVDHFEKITGVSLSSRHRSDWDLQRSTGDVKGYAFEGVVTEMAGCKLGREIYVRGFNHNIQSSFGISRKLMNSISQWIGEVDI